MGLVLKYMHAILCCWVVTVCYVGSKEVSAKINGYSFDFVMTELIKQRLENADTKRELVKQQLDAAVMKKHFEKLSAELEAQKSAFSKKAGEIEQLRKAQTTRGSSYIRWGRTTCSGDTIILYKGYAAGAIYILTEVPAATTHDQPQWSRYQAGVQSGSSIYGVEYEIFNDNVFSYANNGGSQLGNHPAPCAMCYVSTRSTTVMIPARTECPAGWTKEYQGYIVSEHNGNQRKEYICWDQAPETATGASSQNQAIVYTVEVMCGSLPCSRYTKWTGTYVCRVFQVSSRPILSKGFYCMQIYVVVRNNIVLMTCDFFLQCAEIV